MSTADIEKKITPILEAYNVVYAGVFGSVARGDDRPDSDIDLLVTTQKPVSLYTFMALKEALEEALGRDVDLVSSKAVNQYLEPHINKDLVTLYEKR